MPFDVRNFRGEFEGSGARPNMFDITLTFPQGLGIEGAAAATTKITFMAKAASLPADNIGLIQVPYFGRMLKYPGDKTFDPWRITVYNDENFVVRNAFEQWVSRFNAHVANIRDSRADTPRNYMIDMYVQQYAKIGPPSPDAAIKRYKFVGAYPDSVGPIELDWGTDNTVEMFDVNIQYQWWESDTTDSSGE